MKKIIISSLLFVGISLTHILNAQNEDYQCSKRAWRLLSSENI